MKVRSRTDREGQWTCSDMSVHQRHCSLLLVAPVHMTNEWQLKSLIYVTDKQQFK